MVLYSRPDDESNIVRDGTGRPIKHKDGSVETKADITRIAELVGAKAEPDLSCIRITTAVGITSHNAEEVPVAPKADAELQVNAKPKFGENQGFKRT